ncbi:hypothetical protein J6590_086349 [Homalodisca vitripennis]|nr:hypothetical protein J6590_086349 [Homalodisca vitripennis]
MSCCVFNGSHTRQATEGTGFETWLGKERKEVKKGKKRFQTYPKSTWSPGFVTSQDTHPEYKSTPL